MSHFFSDDTGMARRLAELANSVRGRSRMASASARRAKAAREDIEDDVGFLALTLLSLVGSLIEKGVIEEKDLTAHLERVDSLDGDDDEELSPDVLRRALGFPPKPKQEPQAPKPAKSRRQARKRCAGS